jgi:hypothetical protein
VTAAEYRDLDREQALHRLDALNHMMTRLGAEPLTLASDVREADLPLDNLREVVSLEADHYNAVRRAMAGTL